MIVPGTFVLPCCVLLFVIVAAEFITENSFVVCKMGILQFAVKSLQSFVCRLWYWLTCGYFCNPFVISIRDTNRSLVELLTVTLNIKKKYSKWVTIVTLPYVKGVPK